jgi:hypothetical protein
VVSHGNTATSTVAPSSTSRVASIKSNTTPQCWITAYAIQYQNNPTYGPLLYGGSVAWCNVSYTIYVINNWWDYWQSAAWFSQSVSGPLGQSSVWDFQYYECYSPYQWGNLWHIQGFAFIWKTSNTSGQPWNIISNSGPAGNFPCSPPPWWGKLV